MPRYGEDQCEECGGVRVTKSKLCADCLVKACAFKSGIIRHLTEKKLDLERKIESQRGLLKEAMAYGFKQNQENVRLHQHLLQRAQSIEKERKDEKDRKAENTEKG